MDNFEYKLQHPVKIDGAVKIDTLKFLSPLVMDLELISSVQSLVMQSFLEQANNQPAHLEDSTAVTESKIDARAYRLLVLTSKEMATILQLFKRIILKPSLCLTQGQAVPDDYLEKFSHQDLIDSLAEYLANFMRL